MADRVAPDGTDCFRLDEVTARHIRYVMGITGGKIEGKRGTARILGINPATLRHRMQKLGIPFGRSRKRIEESSTKAT